MKLRTIPCDYESRRRSKTDRACVLCQKDLTGPPKRRIHIIAGGGQIPHPDDEAKYVPDSGDMLSHEIGNGCARKIGLEWTHEPEAVPTESK